MPFRLVHVLTDGLSMAQSWPVFIVRRYGFYKSARTDTPLILPQTAIPRQPGSMNESWL